MCSLQNHTIRDPSFIASGASNKVYHEDPYLHFANARTTDQYKISSEARPFEVPLSICGWTEMPLTNLMKRYTVYRPSVILKSSCVCVRYDSSSALSYCWLLIPGDGRAHGVDNRPGGLSSSLRTPCDQTDVLPKSKHGNATETRSLDIFMTEPWRCGLQLGVSSKVYTNGLQANGGVISAINPASR